MTLYSTVTMMKFRIWKNLIKLKKIQILLSLNKNYFIINSTYFMTKFFWYGTRAVKKKNLIDFEWLRQIKPKKYRFFRLDTLFKKNKYTNLKIIKNGGWHFTRVLTPEEIHVKN